MSRDMKYKILTFIMNNKALIILIFFAIFLSVASDNFLTQVNLINVLRQSSVSIIIGIGFTVLLSTGGLDLSVGALVGLIGMITCKMSLVNGMPFGIILVVGVVLGILCGLANGIISTTFVVPAMIVTVATQNVFNGFTYLISDNSAVVGLPDIYINMGQGYLGILPIPVIIMICVVALGWFLLNKTTFGRHCLAVGGNAEAARVSGINVKKVKLLAFSWVSACAALAGMVYAGRVGSGQVSAGSGMEMDIMAGVVIGGTTIGGGNGKMIGTVFGCLMIQVINNGMNLLGIDTNWQVVAKGALILVAVILDSQGEKLIRKTLVKAA